MCEVVIGCAQCEDSLLDQRGFHVIVFQDYVLLQSFDSVVLLGLDLLGQQDLHGGEGGQRWGQGSPVES